MRIPEFQFQLLILWIVVAAVALLGVAAVLVWAVRTRQFSHQDHARYLPLESGIPDEESRDDHNEEKRGGRHV